MDEPPSWRERSRQRIDDAEQRYLRKLRDLADEEPGDERQQELRRKYRDIHREERDIAIRMVHDDEEAVKAFVKRHRLDPDDVLVDDQRNYSIPASFRVKRREERLKHRASFAQRNGLVPPVAGPAAIEEAVDNGEPLVATGVIRLPKAPEPPIARMKNLDTWYNEEPFNGEFDAVFNIVNTMQQGAANGQRVGTIVRVKAFEFRFRIKNVREKFQMQDTYGWDGYSVPAAAISPIEGSDGKILQFYSLDDNVAMQFTNKRQNYYDGTVLPFQYAEPALLAGDGSLAPLPGCDTNLSYATTFNGEPVPLQAAYNVPFWQSPAIFSANGVEAGNVSPCRVVVLWDRFGQDAKYVLDPFPTWFDILDPPPVDGSPVVCPYSIPALERFVVLYDTVWEPNTTNNEMTVVCKPTELCMEAYYPSGAALIKPTSGVLMFAIASTDGVRIIPPAAKNHTYTGFFRVVYEDN